MRVNGVAINNSSRIIDVSKSVCPRQTNRDGHLLLETLMETLNAR